MRDETTRRWPIGSVADKSPHWPGRVLSAALVVAAIAIAAVPPLRAVVSGASGARGAIIVVGLLAAAFLVGRLAASWRRVRPRGWLTFDDAGIVRVFADPHEGQRVSQAPGKHARLARWGEAFGVIVLANHARTRMLLAFTNAKASRYVGVRVAPGELAEDSSLLAHAATIAESDIADALGDDDASLSGPDAESMIAALAARAPGVLERLYLSDARGEAIAIEGPRLRIGERVVDLAAPLEWRAFLFREPSSTGNPPAAYQGTWVRQAETEAVFVAAMPGESSWARDLEASMRGDTRDATVRRAIARDLRLMHSPPAEAPPREQRRAIDRLYMLPLRQALDRAPRVTRAPTPPPRSMPGGAVRF